MAMDQYRRMLHSQIPKQSDCSQELLGRISGTINQFKNLDSLNAQLLRFHASQTTIQTKNRTNASICERCTVLGIQVNPGWV